MIKYLWTIKENDDDWDVLILKNSYWKVKQILIYFIEKKWSKYFKNNNISNNNKNNMKESFNNIMIKKW